MDSCSRPVILLMGPTASGKTDLALQLAERLPCEIVSVDSAMVYRGMDIGTAKPSPETLARAPHRLIDICEPSDAYSADRFRRDALAAIDEIAARGRTPLLVGGTMLYFRVLQRGLSPLPASDPAVRARLGDQARREGAEAMHRWLARVDPQAALRIHANDPQRVQRALEVFLLTGEPITRLWRAAGTPGLRGRVLKLVRSPRERAQLHRRIGLRFEAMLAEGLEQEVRALWRRGHLSADLPSMRCVGYRQMISYLSGACGFDEMARRAVIATRQLAKRQYTWLRSEPDCHWLWDDMPVLERALGLIDTLLE